MYTFSPGIEDLCQVAFGTNIALLFCPLDEVLQNKYFIYESDG
jgi:hypothetical protein